MAFKEDIFSALSGLVDGKVYPQIAPQEEEFPFVIWRIITRDDLTAMGGHQGKIRYNVVFEGWAETYDAATTLAEQIRTAIDGSSLVSYVTNASGEDYEPVLDAHMEPVYYGFWHTT